MALINDPRKLFAYKLGTVLSGEKKILTMLKKLEKRAQRDELKQQFRHHREETEGQIKNIEQAFNVLGEKATGRTNPVVMGLAEQADVLYDKTDDEILDTVLLGGAAETEHVEIALYEDLITQARAMGEQQVVSLLQQNLEQEQHTLEEVKRASEQLAQRSGRQPVSVGSTPQASGFSDILAGRQQRVALGEKGRAVDERPHVVARVGALLGHDLVDVLRRGEVEMLIVDRPRRVDRCELDHLAGDDGSHAQPRRRLGERKRPHLVADGAVAEDRVCADEEERGALECLLGVGVGD